MEAKRKLLIQVLTKLKPYRNLAEGILALVESEYCDEKALDGTAKFITERIKHIKEAKQKEWVQKIKDIEKNHHETEIQDIQEAETLLKTI